MNSEQAKTIVRHTGSAIGGFLVGWAASRGYQWGEILQQLLSSEVVIGLLASGLMAFWGYIGKKLPNLVKLINAQPEVAGVITAPTPEGVKLANAIPDATVVPAGTEAAKAVAETPK